MGYYDQVNERSAQHKGLTSQLAQFGAYTTRLLLIARQQVYTERALIAIQSALLKLRRGKSRYEAFDT